MFRRTFLVLVMCGLAVSSSRADDADPRVLEAKLEKLLESYNKDDVKTFFADWAKIVESITNQMTYDVLYKGAAKNSVGDYVPKSLKLRKEGSVLNGDFLVVYFEAEFSKAKQAEVTVNFQKEATDYKFIQVQMAKKP